MMMLTWETLIARESELARLRADVEAVEDIGGPYFCANKIWYIRFKPRLGELVGWSARKDDPLLRSPQAYALAHKTLYRLLPDCRDCICFL